MVKDRWPSTQASIIERLANWHDDAAWQLAIEIYTPPVLQYCLARGLQSADALDISQEVLAKLKDFEYQPEKGKFRAWLGTVTRNQVNLFWRKKKPLDQLDQPDQLQGNANIDWDRISKAHILDASLARIRAEFSEIQWTVFETLALAVQHDGAQRRFVWQAKGNPSDVATQLDRPVEWVYKTKSAILKRLREEIVFLAEELAIID